MISTIIEQERKAREIIKRNEYLIEDDVYRAYGILKYSRSISVDEALSLLSKVRLGISMEYIKGILLEKITSLMLDVQDNSLQLILKETIENDKDIKRAEYIRKEIA